MNEAVSAQGDVRIHCTKDYDVSLLALVPLNSILKCSSLIMPRSLPACASSFSPLSLLPQAGGSIDGLVEDVTRRNIYRKEVAKRVTDGEHHALLL